MAEGTKMLRSNSSEDHASIEIGEADKLLAVQMKKLLSQTIPLSSQCCIYRVPYTFRTASTKAYVPQTVSIGPFHHNKKSLQAAERFKRIYLDSLLGRAPTPQTKLECLIDAIRKLEQDCRDCYEQDINDFSSNDFVQMMLIDGCFILEMFRREALVVEIDNDDPVFRTARMHFNIKRDMILLENQIPMLVLKCLFDLTTVPEPEGWSLIDLCLNYLDDFGRIVPMYEGTDSRNTNPYAKHLLDLLHKSCISPTIIGMEPGPPEYINCATEIHDAGVIFKNKDKASSLLDMTFKKNGAFEIPHLQVQDSTETLFRNLVAFEQCYEHYHDFITSYLFLMDKLLRSSKDVQLLRRKGIITNRLGSDEEVSAVFNKLCKEVVLGRFYFSGLCKSVNAYSSSPFHKWQASLRRDNFTTPWKLLSLLVIFLTFTGTLFAILSFAVHGS